MPSESNKNDIRNVWQSQQGERIRVSLDVIRYKAQQREENARSKMIFSIALAIALSLVFAWAGVRAASLIARIGWGVLAAWCAYFAFHAYRFSWRRSPAPDATPRMTLDFYRSQLERQRDYVTHMFWRAGLPVAFAGLGMVIVPPLLQSPDAMRLLPNTAPFFLLLVVWAVAFAYQRRRSRRKLDEDIEELRAYERENR